MAKKETKPVEVEETTAGMEQTPPPAEENAGASPDAQGEEKKNTKGNEPENITRLRERYPNNKTFYQTTDGQVFLENDYSLALAHQRTLKGRGKVITY